MWKWAVAGAAMGSILMVYASVRDKKPQGAKDSAFFTVVSEPNRNDKSDRLQVFTEPVEQESVEQKPVEQKPVEQKPVASIVEPRPEPVVVRKPEHNICTHHGMHKVITHGGKSWRCKR